MRNYQLVLVLKTSLSEANRKKFLESVKSWVKGAKFTKEEEWGEKTLAYIIKRETKGFYVNYLFELKDEFSKDLEKKLMATDDVLRHLLLRK
nr:30S ribosomal protein S6 [Candidatus Levybacteria bacterium]